MEPEISLLRSQGSSTDPYAETDESSPYYSIVYRFNIILPRTSKSF
jgi:hypothetical protein